MRAGPGVANCSCREGFGGDGYDCYSTIGRQISTIAQLSLLNQLLQVFAHTPLSVFNTRLIFHVVGFLV